MFLYFLFCRLACEIEMNELQEIIAKQVCVTLIGIYLLLWSYTDSNRNATSEANFCSNMHWWSLSFRSGMFRYSWLMCFYFEAKNRCKSYWTECEKVPIRESKEYWKSCLWPFVLFRKYIFSVFYFLSIWITVGNIFLLNSHSRTHSFSPVSSITPLLRTMYF